MTVKNQHVVPRSYLKNFANSKGKVYTYNFCSKLYEEKDIKDVCSHRYTYEESKSKIDNHLEIEISKLEDEYLPYIHLILKKIQEGTLVRGDVNHEILFKFMFLQYIRTDSGRILCERAKDGLNPLDHHMNIDEIKEKDKFRYKFNKEFKIKGSLKQELNIQYLIHRCTVRIGVTKNQKFLTSDNPVFALYLPETEKMVLKMVMPISPYVCIYCFYRDLYRLYQDQQQTFPYVVDDRLAINYNQSLINVSNYWIISQDPFNIITKWQIACRKTSD